MDMKGVGEGGWGKNHKGIVVVVPLRLWFFNAVFHAWFLLLCTELMRTLLQPDRSAMNFSVDWFLSVALSQQGKGKRENEKSKSASCLPYANDHSAS